MHLRGFFKVYGISNIIIKYYHCSSISERNIHTLGGYIYKLGVHMAPMRERFCILHFIYYHGDSTCEHAHIYRYVYVGDKSTPWERAWRSGRTCTVFRDQTAAEIYNEKER